MKALKLLFVMLFAFQFAQAKDYTVVVRGPQHPTKGHTEVVTKEGESNDSIVVTPGVDITTINVTVRDLDGTLLQQETTTAMIDNTLILTTPPTNNGCILAIRDDNGIVYQSFEE